MKKIYYLYICLSAAAMLLIGYACVKDRTASSGGKYDPNSLSVQEAKEFFEGFVTDFKVARIGNNVTRSGNKPVITPLWDKGKSFTCDGRPMVEIPFNLPLMAVQTVKDPLADNSATRLKNTIYKLLARKTSEGEIEYYVASYSSDFEYMRHRGNPSKVSLADLSKFSGKIRYYDLQGEFLGGRVLKDGKDAGVIKTSGNLPSSMLPGMQTTRSGHYEDDCEVEIIDGEDCTTFDWEIAEEDAGSTEQCTPYSYSETVCTPYWVDDGDTGGSGGGGGDGTQNGGTLQEVVVVEAPNLARIINLLNLSPAITKYMMNLEYWLTISMYNNGGGNQGPGHNDDPNCAEEYLFGTLLDGAGVNLKFGPIAGGKAGLYDPATNTLTIDPNCVDPNTFYHELLHAAEKALGYDFGPTLNPDDEYEARLLADFMELKATGQLSSSVTVSPKDDAEYRLAIQKAADNNDFGMLETIRSTFAVSANANLGPEYPPLNPSATMRLLNDLIAHGC